MIKVTGFHDSIESESFQTQLCEYVDLNELNHSLSENLKNWQYEVIHICYNTKVDIELKKENNYVIATNFFLHRETPIRHMLGDAFEVPINRICHIMICNLFLLYHASKICLRICDGKYKFNKKTLTKHSISSIEEFDKCAPTVHGKVKSIILYNPNFTEPSDLIKNEFVKQLHSVFYNLHREANLEFKYIKNGCHIKFSVRNPQHFLVLHGDGQCFCSIICLTINQETVNVKFSSSNFEATKGFENTDTLSLIFEDTCNPISPQENKEVVEIPRRHRQKGVEDKEKIREIIQDYLTAIPLQPSITDKHINLLRDIVS